MSEEASHACIDEGETGATGGPRGVVCGVEVVRLTTEVGVGGAEVMPFEGWFRFEFLDKVRSPVDAGGECQEGTEPGSILGYTTLSLTFTVNEFTLFGCLRCFVA